jgi:hypothetical protein
MAVSLAVHFMAACFLLAGSGSLAREEVSGRSLFGRNEIHMRTIVCISQAENEDKCLIAKKVARIILATLGFADGDRP